MHAYQNKRVKLTANSGVKNGNLDGHSDDESSSEEEEEEEDPLEKMF